MRDHDREFADAARVVDESVVIRAIMDAAAAVESSFEQSTTRRILRQLHVTQIGVVITSACVTHALLLRRMADALAPAKPLGYGVVVAFAALAVAAGRMTTRSSATATAESSAGTAKTTKS
jgi:hypothetical protein